MSSVLTHAPEKLENEYWSGVIFANGINTHIPPPSMIKIAYIELKQRVGVRGLRGRHNMETIFDPQEYRSGEVDLNI